MIMCTFCLLEWSFNLVVPSLYLVMSTFHLVKMSYFFGYVLLSFASGLFLFSCLPLSFRYLLFLLFALLCTVCMRSWYVLFLSTLFMCSVYVIFAFAFLCTLVCTCYIRSLNALFLCRLLH